MLLHTHRLNGPCRCLSDFDIDGHGPQEDFIPDIEFLTESARDQVTVEASDVHGEVASVAAEEADGPSEAPDR